MTAPARLRCAIYTRKSTEEGLEQAFNSLDAQRESCEAYIKSQAHEGWRALPNRFDDGGYSGGSMERPGLKALLEHIEQGAIDIIVVYKVDRLTRSLADFAKIVETFERHHTSFVSVTQHFNTTSSMGRLTLNVLLSFAQFEREIIGERVRDKIAASKQKGMWMGGNPPLGYDIRDRSLMVNEAEAEIVRSIFARYLELCAVDALARDLRDRGIRSKRWTTQSGRARGGEEFSRGALYHLLRNPAYIGEIQHRGSIHQGLHAPILSREIWDQVQARLAANRNAARSSKSPSGASLSGLLFDDRGNVMSPSHARKGNRRYRYYVSQALLQGRPKEAGSLSRMSAPAIESFVIERLNGWFTPKDQNRNDAPDLRSMIKRIEISDRQVVLRLNASLECDIARLQTLAADVSIVTNKDGSFSITIPVRLRLSSGRTAILAPDHGSVRRSRTDPALIKALVRTQRWRQALMANPEMSIPDLARSSGCTVRYVQDLLDIGFLAPELVDMILEGRQAPGLVLSRLIGSRLPLSWRDQIAALGAIALR